MTDTAWPARYELLDGLRGLAALAVLMQHIGIGDAGHFAVMVFFVISGYCITASADSYRRSGAGFGHFMYRRARRIYPPYLLAMAFFALTRAIKLWSGGENSLDRPLLEWLQNLTLTQWVSNLFHPVNSPWENPKLFVVAFWSLNYEEQFYLVVGLGLLAARYLRVPTAFYVLALAAVGLVWNWSIPGNWICGLFIEYWPHFALGSCLYFVLCRFADMRSRRLFTLVTVLIGTACSVRVLLWQGNSGDELRAMVELSFLCATTLALFLLRPFSPAIAASGYWRPVAALGTISYSLYLIHQFNLKLVATAAHYCLPARAPQFAVVLATIALHLALATVFWYFCERPFLRKKPAVRQGQGLDQPATQLA